MGYANYYLTLLTDLGCLDEINGSERLISTGITRINKTKSGNRRRKQTISSKRRRKHGRNAKTKQQLFEEGVDRANKMGTYQTGIGIVGNEQEQQQQNTQQSATRSTVTNRKVCGKCGQQGHKTWRANACAHHAEYIESQNTNQNKKNKTSTNTQLINSDGANKVSTNSGAEVSSVAVVGRSFSATAKAEAMAVKAIALVPMKKTGHEAQNVLQQFCVFIENENLPKRNVNNNFSKAPSVPKNTRLPYKNNHVAPSNNHTGIVGSVSSIPSVTKFTEVSAGDVGSVPPSTCVHHRVARSTSTTVNPTENEDNEDKQKIDSTIESEEYVEYDVQNFDFLNVQEDIDESYNSDNSEISFFTAVDSVNDNVDEAL